MSALQYLKTPAKGLRHCARPHLRPHGAALRGGHSSEVLHGRGEGRGPAHGRKLRHRIQGGHERIRRGRVRECRDEGRAVQRGGLLAQDCDVRVPSLLGELRGREAWFVGRVVEGDAAGDQACDDIGVPVLAGEVDGLEAAGNMMGGWRASGG